MYLIKIWCVCYINTCDSEISVEIVQDLAQLSSALAAAGMPGDDVPPTGMGIVKDPRRLDLTMRFYNPLYIIQLTIHKLYIDYIYIYI